MRRMEIGRRELAWDPPQPVNRIGSNCYVQQDVGSIIAHAQPIHFCHIVPNQAEAKGFGSITRMDRITSIIGPQRE